MEVRTGALLLTTSTGFEHRDFPPRGRLKYRELFRMSLAGIFSDWKLVD